MHQIASPHQSSMQLASNFQPSFSQGSYNFSIFQLYKSVEYCNSNESESKRSKFDLIQLSDAWRGLAWVAPVNRRSCTVTDFSYRVMLHWPCRAALVFSSVKATRPPSVAQFFNAGEGPWAVRAPAWIPRGSLRRNVFTKHDHSVVHIADGPW